VQAAVPRSRQAAVTRAGYLGSPTNLVRLTACIAPHSLALLQSCMRMRDVKNSAAQRDKQPYMGELDMLQIFIASTAAFLTAGRFGLAPTAKKHTKAGLKLYDDDSEGEDLRRRN
jgi:hypothetical protein